jgi:hypothetical protein
VEEKPKNEPVDQNEHGYAPQQPPIVYQTYNPPPQGRSCLYLVAGVVIVVIVICVSFFGFGDKIKEAFAPKLPPTAVAVVDMSNTITNAVVSKGMLVTSESHQSNRNIRVNVIYGLLNANGYGASHFAEGTIFAGVDLESDLVQVTKIDDKHYKIMLPAPQITSCSLKPLTQYDRSTSAVANWDSALDLASYMALNEFVNTALEGGLLDDAKQSAKRVVGDLIRAVVGTDIGIEIDFHTVETPKIDDTCIAHEPLSWAYNAETAEWSPK